MRNRKVLLILSTAFIATETLLGILVQTLSGHINTAVSYAAVLLAFLFAFLFFERTKRYAFTQIALLFTVCADFFLVVRGAKEQFLAMLFFSVTQLAYAARLYFEDENKARRFTHLALRIGFPLLVLAITLVVLDGAADRVALISMFYFANLALNVTFACMQFKKAPLLAIGLILFLCCDVFVGLSLIEGWLPLTKGSILYALAHPGFNAAWLFYVPSQTLLALSVLPQRKQ